MGSSLKCMGKPISEEPVWSRIEIRAQEIGKVDSEFTKKYRSEILRPFFQQSGRH